MEVLLPPATRFANPSWRINHLGRTRYLYWNYCSLKTAVELSFAFSSENISHPWSQVFSTAETYSPLLLDFLRFEKYLCKINLKQGIPSRTSSRQLKGSKSSDIWTGNTVGKPQPSNSFQNLLALTFTLMSKAPISLFPRPENPPFLLWFLILSLIFPSW